MAIAILAVVSLPIISAFSSAAKINLKARREENSNAVAQKVMEGMKASTVQNAMNVADSDADEYGTSWISLDNSGYDFSSYMFNMGAYDATGNRFTSSSKGDKFYVRVTLDPTAYSDKTDGSSSGNNMNNVNSYKKPSFTEVQSVDNIAILKEIYENDDAAIQYFANKGIARTAINRRISININITDKDASGSENKDPSSGKVKYTQKVSMEVQYTAVGTSDVYKEEYVFNTDGANNFIYGNIQDSKYKDLYVFYTPFDKYDDTPSDKVSKDSISVNVTYDTISGKAQSGVDCFTGKVMKPKKINVYLVEQETKAVNDANSVIYFPKDVELKVQGNSYLPTGTTGTLGYGPDKEVNILTNATKTLTNTVGGSVTNSITTNLSGESAIKDLYDMKIEVWVNEEPSNSTPAFWTVMSTKESADE